RRPPGGGSTPGPTPAPSHTAPPARAGRPRAASRRGTRSPRAIRSACRCARTATGRPCTGPRPPLRPRSLPSPSGPPRAVPGCGGRGGGEGGGGGGAGGRVGEAGGGPEGARPPVPGGHRVPVGVPADAEPVDVHGPVALPARRPRLGAQPVRRVGEQRAQRDG